MPGRNIEVGKSKDFDVKRPSATALVKTYVLGKDPNKLEIK